MRLQLDKTEFFAHLKAREFTHLFHANSVATSLSFFSQNSIGSRKQLEEVKLAQSEQYTDTLDKKYGVWDDVFLNFHDHHRRFNRPNAYGPLTFRVRLDALEQILTANKSSSVSVCLKNVERWSDQDSLTDRWVGSIPELNELFEEPIAPGEKKGFFKDGKFPDIVIGGVRNLSLNAVDKILVEQNLSWPEHFDTLKDLISEVWPKVYRRLEIVVTRRYCPDKCKCQQEETFGDEKIRRLFSFGDWEARYPKHFSRKTGDPSEQVG